MSSSPAQQPEQQAQQAVGRIDWSGMQALFVKGCSYRELSERYGIPMATIRSRAFRHKWPQVVAEAATLVKQGAINDLSDSVRSWVAKIDKFTHKAIDSLIERDPSQMKVKEIQELAQAAKTLSEVYRPNAGLDQQRQASGAHVALQVNVSRDGRTTVSHAAAPVDIESAPSE